MDSPSNQQPFHFFGDVYLEDPVPHLDANAMNELEDLMQTVRIGEQDHQTRPMTLSDLEWLNRRFEQFVQEEEAAWERHGVPRSEARFLTRPSGSMTSLLANHLMNPTFFVENLESDVTDDETSPTIRLLRENGFSSTNSLFFDQICRRGVKRPTLTSAALSRMWNKVNAKSIDPGQLLRARGELLGRLTLAGIKTIVMGLEHTQEEDSKSPPSRKRKQRDCAASLV